MRLRINRKTLDDSFDGEFYLYNGPIKVHTTVPNKTRKGIPEMFLVYRTADDIPGPDQEPELFRIPHEEEKRGSNRFLNYSLARIVLLDLASDEKYRRENQDYIGEVEFFGVEEWLNQPPIIGLITEKNPKKSK